MKISEGLGIEDVRVRIQLSKPMDLRKHAQERNLKSTAVYEPSPALCIRVHHAAHHTIGCLGVPGWHSVLELRRMQLGIGVLSKPVSPVSRYSAIFNGLYPQRNLHCILLRA